MFYLVRRCFITLLFYRLTFIAGFILEYRHPLGLGYEREMFRKTSNYSLEQEGNRNTFLGAVEEAEDKKLEDFLMVPAQAVWFHNRGASCPARHNEIIDCSTKLIPTSSSRRLWPKFILTAACRCSGQRCNPKGLHRCATILSRVPVIRHTGERSRDLVPIACECLARISYEARHVQPLLV